MRVGGGRGEGDIKDRQKKKIIKMKNKMKDSADLWWAQICEVAAEQTPRCAPTNTIHTIGKHFTYISSINHIILPLSISITPPRKRTEEARHPGLTTTSGG
jgi:hypothetical protein